MSWHWIPVIALAAAWALALAVAWLTRRLRLEADSYPEAQDDPHTIPKDTQ